MIGSQKEKYLRTEEDFYRYAESIGAEIFTLTMCPFCGGPPVLHVHETKVEIKDKQEPILHAYVFCHECGARAGEEDDYDPDPEDIQGRIDLQVKAMRNWNDRDGRTASAWQNDLSSLYISPGDGQEVRLREFMEGKRA